MKTCSLLISLPIVLSLSLGANGSYAKVEAPPPPPSGEEAPPPPPGAASSAQDGGEKAGKPNSADAAQSSGPVSGSQTEAESQYQAGNYEAAAVQFRAIATGQSGGDGPRAQFWLGKTLYKLEFYGAALAIFDQIVQAGPSHPYHRVTLPWLASMSRVLPEGAGVLEKVGTYKPSELEHEAFDEVRDELYYLLGRFYYLKGDLGQAIALLTQVPNESDFYIPAQFFMGVAETRELKAEPAVAAFKEVLRKNLQLREGEDRQRARKRKKKERLARLSIRKRKKLGLTEAELEFDEQNERFFELASLSLGFIFYQVGKFSTAIKYFDRVPMTSPYWLDAVFAGAWSEFRMGEVEPELANVHNQRTLGYIHTLNAPFFHDYLYPEALVLKADIYYYNCQYGPAKGAIDEFNERYLKTKEDLQTIVSSAPDDFAFYEITLDIRRGKSSHDPFVEKVAQKALQDKTLERNYAYVERLEYEIEKLKEMGADFRDGGVGDLISENVDLTLSLAKEQTGALARKRLLSKITEIKKLERDAIKVEYEILNKLKELGVETPNQMQKPTVDREHEIYNYNGEYWQDELGFYYYKVNSVCKE